MKSTYSNSQGNCVDVKKYFEHEQPRYVVTDTKLGDYPSLVFSEGEWDAFISGVKDGQFDLDQVEILKENTSGYEGVHEEYQYPDGSSGNNPNVD